MGLDRMIDIFVQPGHLKPVRRDVLYINGRLLGIVILIIKSIKGMMTR